MMKMLITAILVAISLATPAVAQTTHPEVPQDQVTEKAKPFVGTWQAIACDPDAPAPYGITFSVRVETVQDPDTGVKTTKPIFKLTGFQGVENFPSFDFATLDFTEIVGDTPEKHFLWIDVENPNLVLNLQAALPNTLKVGLNGVVTVVATGTMYSLFAQPATKADDPWAYLTTLSKACTVSQGVGQNEATLR